MTPGFLSQVFILPVCIKSTGYIFFLWHVRKYKKITQDIGKNEK